MLGACRWLALESKSPESTAAFYSEHLSVPTVETSDREVSVRIGEGSGSAELRFRRPDGVPRGGLHTHYALSCPADAYDAWYDRLSAEFDLLEVDFGTMHSLYLYDPLGNCVEIGGTDDVRGLEEPTLSGIFEIVLEVESLPDAERFYTDLGFEIIDRGEGRRRTRLTTGPFDIELWEPHLGLADARGGVHVDVGIVTSEPSTAAGAVSARLRGREPVPEGIRIRDPDGHYLTLVDAEV